MQAVRSDQALRALAAFAAIATYLFLLGIIASGLL